jgi:hypothetical protein
MKKFFLPLAVTVLLGIAGCGGAQTVDSNGQPVTVAPPSPREQDYNALLAYAAMQSIVLQALKTPQVQANADLKAKIKAGEQAARAAMLDYDTQARKCLRDDTTGQIGNAPGQVCNPSDVTRALTSLSTAIASAQSFAAQYAPAPTKL